MLNGVPFREAYKNIGLDIENGTYKPLKEVNHTHEGSIGNLMKKQISEAFEKVIQDFNFEKVHQALNALVQELEKPDVLHRAFCFKKNLFY